MNNKDTTKMLNANGKYGAVTVSFIIKDNNEQGSRTAGERLLWPTEIPKSTDSPGKWIHCNDEPLQSSIKLSAAEIKAA